MKGFAGSLARRTRNEKDLVEYCTSIKDRYIPIFVKALRNRKYLTLYFNKWNLSIIDFKSLNILFKIKKKFVNYHDTLVIIIKFL